MLIAEGLEDFTSSQRSNRTIQTTIILEIGIKIWKLDGWNMEIG